MKKEPAADTLIDLKNPHLVAVLDNKSAIASTEATIASLEALIEGKQAEDSKAHSEIPKTDHLPKQREDLLASVAIGQATEDDVKKFDSDHAAEFDAAAKAIEKYRVIKNEVDQAIAGLTRKLDEAKAQFADLKAESKPLLLGLLRSLADQYGEFYIKAATEAYERYMQLLSLEQLSGSLGVPLSIRHYEWTIKLPRIRIEACKDVGSVGRPEFLFSDWESVYGTKIADGATVLHQALKAAGVGSN